MDEVLRRSAAHMLTPDINDPLLSDDALHHLNRVLRLREGESVTVTNGNGEWRQCCGRIPGLRSQVRSTTNPLVMISRYWCDSQR